MTVTERILEMKSAVIYGLAVVSLFSSNLVYTAYAAAHLHNHGDVFNRVAHKRHLTPTGDTDVNDSEVVDGEQDLARTMQLG